jgi:hypothetical protein
MSILYYPVWISPGRKTGHWSFGPPCTTPREADQVVKEHMATGATLGCVVEMAAGHKRPMAGHVQPPAAKKIIAHWEQLWGSTE